MFGSYDHLMIVYPVYCFMTSGHFVLLRWQHLILKREFLNDNSFKTIEAV